MLHTGNESTMLGAAVITNNGVPDPQIEEPIKGGRANQDDPCHQRIIPPMGPKKSQASQRENGQTQPVREILLLVQLAIAAYQARGQFPFPIGTKVLPMIALRALPGPRLGEIQPSPMVTRRTPKSNS